MYWLIHGSKRDMGYITEAVLIALEGRSPESAIKTAEDMAHICVLPCVKCFVTWVSDHNCLGRPTRSDIRNITQEVGKRVLLFWCSRICFRHRLDTRNVALNSCCMGGTARDCWLASDQTSGYEFTSRIQDVLPSNSVCSNIIPFIMCTCMPPPNITATFSISSV